MRAEEETELPEEGLLEEGVDDDGFEGDGFEDEDVGDEDLEDEGEGTVEADAAHHGSAVIGEARHGGHLDAIRAATEPLCVVHGVSLVDVIWTTERIGRTLRVTIERINPDGTVSRGGGVSVDDCADLSRDVSAALDLVEGLDQAYTLEVSSPGLDRPLRTVSDFRRFVGDTAKIKLTTPASDGQRVLRGELLAVDPEGEVIDIEVDGKVHHVPFKSVESAALVFELRSGAKPSKKAPGKKAAGKKAAGKKGSSPQKGSGPGQKGGPRKTGAKKKGR